MSKLDILRSITFGQRVAEDETDLLGSYFVETDNWRRIYDGSVDIVYGTKGAGKSALYSLLVERASKIFENNIFLVPAENPRGAPAFRDLNTDPPTSENEFVGLWKLYFSSLLHGVLQDYGVESSASEELGNILAAEGLVRNKRNLQSLLAAVRRYVTNAFRLESLQAGIEIDQISGVAKGFTGKITFREPGEGELKQGLVSVDYLLDLANRALVEYEDYKIWILLDRLDVAFTENTELEQNALRALFRVYLDLMAFSNIRLKIFLRTDIWNRLARGGFREASHITRHMTIAWNKNSLRNLIIRRAIHNEAIQTFYHRTPQEVLATIDSQVALFDAMFPPQVDSGPKMPETFDWMLSRTCDGTRETAPRELIHLLNSIRDEQIRRLEIGEPEPETDQLFARLAPKDALPEVSRVRLEQTLYAEYPETRQYIERLRGEKTAYHLDTLASFWKLESEQATSVAQNLVLIGFFEVRGEREDPEYWVPFLYRDALEMVRGSAD